MHDDTLYHATHASYDLQSKLANIEQALEEKELVVKALQRQVQALHEKNTEVKAELNAALMQLADANLANMALNDEDPDALPSSNAIEVVVHEGAEVVAQEQDVHEAADVVVVAQEEEPCEIQEF